MNLFNPARLRAAKSLAKGNIAKISDIISKHNPGLAKRFNAACENYDSDGADDALSAALTELLGNDANDCLYAFTIYCKKFGLDLDFSGMSDAEKIHLLASHQTEIRSKLEKEGA